ncbi:hypothetical protein [Virgibacillus sp. YIM 98842]|nr:hypothetical protein [Virgibacillus sp. YIM 98842]
MFVRTWGENIIYSSSEALFVLAGMFEWTKEVAMFVQNVLK